MPKQIDHDSYRRELALKAAPLFSQYGYSGLGMRQVAEELGLSKSALYHYFPTKKDLFLACTEVVMRPPASDADRREKETDPVAALLTIVRDMEPGFASEMSLLFDYLRGKTSSDIASDPAMRLANEALRGQVENWTGPERSDGVLCLLMGTLMMRYFTGGALGYDRIEILLTSLLRTAPVVPERRQP